MRALVVMLVLCSVAHADRRLSFQAGGGLEGGLMAGAARPGGVVHVGIAGEWLSSGGVGIGFAFGTLARSGVDLATYEEDTFDLMLRFARPGVRGGVGAGLRLLTPEDIDGRPQPTRIGFDWLRLDVDLPLGRSQVSGLGVAVGVYVSWTFGCYLASDSGADSSASMIERPEPTMYRPGCFDTITSTYIAGLQFSIVDP